MRMRQKETQTWILILDFVRRLFFEGWWMPQQLLMCVCPCTFDGTPFTCVSFFFSWNTCTCIAPYAVFVDHLKKYCCNVLVCVHPTLVKNCFCRQKRFGKSFACQRSDWRLTERLIDKGSQISNAYTMHLAQVFFEQKQKALYRYQSFCPRPMEQQKMVSTRHIGHWRLEIGAQMYDSKNSDGSMNNYTTSVAR